MKQKTGIFPLAASLFAAGLLLGTSTTQALEVILDDNNNVTRIKDLIVFDDQGGSTVYEVDFVNATGTSVYGSNYNFDFTNEEEAFNALEQVMDALNASNPTPTGASSQGTDQFFIGAEYDSRSNRIAAVGGENFAGIWDQCDIDCVVGTAVLNPAASFTYAVFGPPTGGSDPVDLTGNVKDAGGSPLCSLVLASGKFMFTCNPNGPYSLLDLPREADNSVKRQVYVDGFFPNVKVLGGSFGEDVVMTRAGTCADYNAFPEPGVYPGSNGKRINVSGKIVLQNSQEPVCAMVLANGQFDFTCDGSGTYSGTIPLDANGQYKLQVYAQGFAPMIQRFDEFNSNNDVRLARAAECQ